jgi:hypothetical protein
MLSMLSQISVVLAQLTAKPYFDLFSGCEVLSEPGSRPRELDRSNASVLRSRSVPAKPFVFSHQDYTMFSS